MAMGSTDNLPSQSSLDQPASDLLYMPDGSQPMVDHEASIQAPSGCSCVNNPRWDKKKVVVWVNPVEQAEEPSWAQPELLTHKMWHKWLLL